MTTDAQPTQQTSPPPPPPTLSPPASRAATTSSAQPLPTSAAARFRLPQRQPSNGSPRESPRPPLAARRRSSLISFSSIEDASRSFTEDFLDPRTGARSDGNDENELTHWHSSPLAFAILPAIGGLFFNGGSAFVTDILLLGLAAIFMNWSIRLPWDWYYSAQSLRRVVEPAYDSGLDSLADDTAVETASSAGSSPGRNVDANHGPTVQDISTRERAASDLRRQELLGLGATFLFPVLAAFLLHKIRAQLSVPSNGLVSDYNLSIFVLAAEIRPIRQVVRLVATRTLYLQRTVTGIDDPFLSALDHKSTVNKLADQITDLEARLSEHALVPPTMNVAQKTDVNDLSAEIKKRYEPRLEGLERAVRRYEKRSITMATMTEQRLQSLDTRLQEALSLAAVAAQHSQSRGVVSTFLETAASVIAFPLKIVWSACVYPFVALENLYNRVKTILLGPMPPRPTKRTRSRHDGSNSRESSRAREKTALRKISDP